MGGVTVLVTGAAGQLGRAVVEALGERALPTTRATLDVTDRAAVMAALDSSRPRAVIHTAAWTDVDACESDVERAHLVNAVAVRHLADAAARVDAHLVHVSTDYVFDGAKGRPYTEWDQPAPISVYGASKRAGEVEAGPEATVARTAWMAGDGANVVRTVLRLLDEGRDVAFVDDRLGSPSFAADVAPVLVRLADERRRGVHHVVNDGWATWYGFASDVAEAAGASRDRVRPITSAEFAPRPARRPADARLDGLATRLAGIDRLPHHRDGLARLLRSWGR